MRVQFGQAPTTFAAAIDRVSGAAALLNWEGNMGIRGEVFSSRSSTEKRTYFFNVKENRNGDLFLNIVESKKHGDADFERRSVIVFAEDLDDFVQEFQKAVSFMNRRKP